MAGNAGRMKRITTHPAWRLLWVFVFAFLAVVYALESWTDLHDGAAKVSAAIFGVSAIGAFYVAYRMALQYLNGLRRGPGPKD
jgi:hypothetical protein